MSPTSTGRRFAAVQLAAGSIVAVTASAAAMPAAGANGSTPTYTHRDSGRVVHLAVGTVFRVDLRTCADCGDSWRWVHRPDRQVVKLVRERVVSTAKPPQVGGMARTIYRFRVVGVGRTREVLVENGPSGKALSHFRLTEVTRSAG